jgi:hypothetical protein
VPEVKDFVRFYISQSKGRLTKHATVASTLASIRSFFTGFTLESGTLIDEEVKNEIYQVNTILDPWAVKLTVNQWIAKILSRGEDKICVNVHKPKHNFSPDVLDRLLLALWTRPDLVYIHERSRVQAAFLMHTYCWTGARIDAFFKGGLQYKVRSPRYAHGAGLTLTQHIHLILQRRPGGGTQLAWKIDQTWVKNNRDPENVVYGTQIPLPLRGR